MELEQLHKHMHLNNMANGTVEVLFAGQPALTVHKTGMASTEDEEANTNFCWTINPVFAKLTYGANVISDIPFCQKNYDSVEMAAAMGMEALDSMGAFKTLIDLPEDTYAATMGAQYNADEHIMNREMHSFALSATDGNIMEAAAYLKKFTTKKIKPRGDAKSMCEKLAKGESLTTKESIYLSEHIWMGNPEVFQENGLPITSKMVMESKKETSPVIEENKAEVTDVAKAVESQSTLFEQFKSKKTKLMEERENKRLVSTHENGAHKTKIYRLPDTNEYKVEFHKDGAHQKDVDYFTDDKKDAQGTSTSWLNKGIQEERQRSEFAANTFFMDAARKTASETPKKKMVRIIGPTGGTVSKHDTPAEAQATFKKQGYTMKTHKIVGECSDGQEVDLSQYIAESDEAYEKWASDVQDKHGDKGVVLKGRVEKGVHTTSAEIPGKDRSYAVFDHETNTGHIFESEEDSEEIIGEEFVVERELTDTEAAKREEIVMALKKNKGFVSKYGKDAIWAVATAQAKTAGQ